MHRRGMLGLVLGLCMAGHRQREVLIIDQGLGIESVPGQMINEVQGPPDLTGPEQLTEIDPRIVPREVSLERIAETGDQSVEATPFPALSMP